MSNTSLFFATNRGHQGSDRWKPKNYGKTFSKDGMQNLRFGELTLTVDDGEVKLYFSKGKLVLIFVLLSKSISTVSFTFLRANELRNILQTSPKTAQWFVFLPGSTSQGIVIGHDSAPVLLKPFMPSTSEKIQTQIQSDVLSLESVILLMVLKLVQKLVLVHLYLKELMKRKCSV